MDLPPHPPKVRILLRTLSHQLKFPLPKGLVSGRDRTTLANEGRIVRRLTMAAGKKKSAVPFP